MLAKKVVAHTTCEQIRSSDVLGGGEKPYRAWPSRQPDSSNVVTLSVFGKIDTRTISERRWGPLGARKLLQPARSPPSGASACSMTAASSAQDSARRMDAGWVGRPDLGIKGAPSEPWQSQWIMLPMSACHRRPSCAKQTLANGLFNKRERFLGFSRFRFGNFGAKFYSRQLILFGFNTRLGLF
jgi:hypothetical protein